ncbi:LmeA family phospholipid-binding protein [Mycolicibacterium crocinum]|uniref:LmeA family phospholipid-binding protein n=1 Tax=Mycolicibacterium crocinum TaxID=388459 RepID=UPI003555D372
MSRSLGLLSSVWSTATALPVSSGAAVAYRTVFMTIKRLVVGRTMTVRLDGGDITLTVTEFDSRLDVRGLAVGQLNDVRIAATDIRWGERSFESATVVLHNVHLKPGVPPVLVAAPVEVTMAVSTHALDAVFTDALPRLSGHVDDEGVARLRWSRRPALGSVEVDVTLDGSTLWLRPRAVRTGRRRWALPTRLPAYPVRVPELASGLTLTSLSLGPGSLHLTGSVPQWRTEVPGTRVDDLLAQLSVVGRPLNFTGRPRRT